MNATIRRTLAPTLIGVLAAFGALTALSYARQRECGGLGGQWDIARRACLAADGRTYTSGLLGGRGIILAIVAALLIAWTLWRVYTYPLRRSAGAGRRG